MANQCIIKVLGEEVTNKIAAGEIIERPASIVKELVENSIDAEADSIIISLENGGKRKIRIVDNGKGMCEEDAMLAFERHATSKIRIVDDIVNVSTLGFRGEALPSIASVSRMVLVTKTPEAETATKIDIDFGKFHNVSKTSAYQGTDITITNLFDNLPARKKFLKTDQVEIKHILDYIHYQALCFPQITFKLTHNNQERLNYPAVRENINRYAAVLGSDFLKHDIIKLNDMVHSSDSAMGQMKTAGINMTGFISGLEEQKEGLADFRYVFINGRYIRDRIVIHAINSAYEPFIKKFRIYQQGKLPPFVIFINIKPDMVDCNVHPAKLEIRFRDPHLVHSFIKNTITQHLLDYQDRKFKAVKEQIADRVISGKPQIFDRKEIKKPIYKEILNELYQPSIFGETHNEETKADGKKTDIPMLEPKTVPADIFLPREEDMINPWQLHQSYILVQSDDGLVVLDQHAAHERILYETFFHRMCGVPAVTQKLLFPIVIDVPPILRKTISELIETNIKFIEDTGFSLKTFSGDSVVIDEIPAELSNWEGGEVFKEILFQLKDEFAQTSDFRDSMAKALSCKAAIKAGEKLGKKDMLQLINDLFACQVPFFCPHGRPVLVKITMNEFDRKFKRI